MKKYLLLIAVFLCIAMLGNTETYKVKVESGDYDREGAIVSVKLNAKAEIASVLVDGLRFPAQVQPMQNGGIKIWWVMQPLPANQIKEYEVELGKETNLMPFQWSDSNGKSQDLLLGDRPVLRYMHTPFDANDIENTKKPFHHVFDPSGTQLITKGVGGKYSHHRGIFFGYNKISVGDQMFDIWHAKNGEHSIHKETLYEFANQFVGGHVVRIDWNDKEGNPFIEETRWICAVRQPQGQILIDFRSTLKSVRGDIHLDGDRQHAGAQFRPAQEVAEHEETTRYLRPQAWSKLPEDKQINDEDYQDLPWNSVKYTVGGKRYTVAYLTDPKNPEGAKFSERLYGRFGEFFPYDITEDKPLRVHYQWWIVEGDNVTREEIERRYQNLANPPKATVIE